MRVDKKDLLVYSLYFFLTLLFFHRFLTGTEMFAFKDLSRYFYPLRFLMVEQVKAGILPLWNPYIFCGMPLMATLQVGFFYPLTILLYILPFDLGFNYYTIIHYFLAACFMYMLMRHYSLNRQSAFLSGIVFAFSGYLMSVSNMNTSLSSVIWLPLVMLWWDRVLSSPHPLLFPLSLRERGLGGEGFALTLALSLMFLGGEPTIIYITAWLMLFYALFLYKDRLKNVTSLILIFVVVAGLVAVQLLPFLELLSLSDRAQAADFGMISMRSLPPREVINFVMPFFFGNQLRPGNYSEFLLGDRVQDWLLSPYLGFLVLFFALLAVFRRDNRTAFFGVAGLVALVLAFGKYTPLFWILYKIIPGFSLIRYPVKYLFLTTFSLAYLSGLGFKELMGWGEDKLKKSIGYLLLILSILGPVALLFVVFRGQFYIFVKGLYSGNMPEFYAQELLTTIKFDIKSLIDLWGFVFAGTLTLFLILRKALSKSVGMTILIAIVLLDLAVVNIPLSYPLPARVYHEVPKNVQRLLQDRSLSRYFYTNGVERVNRRIFGEVFSEGMLENKDKLAANRLVPYHLYDVYGYESVQLNASRRLSKYYDKAPLKLINMMNGKYIAAESRIGLGLKPVSHTEYYFGELFLYESPKYLPRAFIVYSARTAMHQEAALAEIMKPDLDPAKEIVLEEPLDLGRRIVGSPVRIIKYSPSEIILEGKAEGPGVLFISDTYYPGWKAYDNGQEVKILRANYMFRAIELGKGEHNIRFVYDPLSFKLGLMLSLLTFLGLAGAGWYFRAKKN